MQDQDISDELDPWKEWPSTTSPHANSSTQQADEWAAHDGNLGHAAAEECHPLAGEQGPQPSLQSAEDWSVPTAEELSHLISCLSMAEGASASDNGASETCDPTKRSYEPDKADVLPDQLSEVDSNLPARDWTFSHDSTFPSEPNSSQVGSKDSVGSAIESLDTELREAFLDDATFCMGAIETAAMLLETNADNREAILQISRQLHTLKGASASVGLEDMAERLHSLEEVIRSDQLQGKVTPVDLLLERLDWFRFQLSTIRNQKQAASGDTNGWLKNDMPAHSTNPGGSEFAEQVMAASEPLIIETADDEDSVRVKTSQLNRLMDLLSELVMLRNRRQTETSELREIYHELNGSVAKLRLLGSLNTRSMSNSGAMRHQPGVAEDLHNLSAWAEEGSLQLSEIAADVQEMAQRVRECIFPVAEGNEAVSQFIRQFRVELVELCRAPTTGLLQRLQRVVRDAAKIEGKAVRLESIGAAATVERSLQQRLYEPLLHIVRNAVCHGIEASEQRQAAGKSATGVITLEVISAADLLVLEVRDDGGGLNYQAIRQRAVQQGLLTSGHSPTEHELAQLIFHPGFSTRQSVNQSAGRGVGMDVVAATLSRLGGWIDVESVSGKGTTMRLNIPLRSAIEHLMVFRCGREYYAIPLLAIHSAGETDEHAPSVVLGSLFTKDYQAEYEDLASLQVDLETAAIRKSNHPVQRVNLLIDEIIGPEEVVVRPLPTLLRSHPYCAGATLSSTGQTVLVLDARKLIQTLSQQELILADLANSRVTEGRYSSVRESFESMDHRAAINSHASGSQPLVLVVDDSVSSRKAVVRSLKRFPMKVMEATDGRQALQLLKSHRFAAIFSDLEMPHVDGLELLAEVRSRESTKNMPFTMITSRQEMEFSAKAQSLGVTRYLGKPIHDAALDSALLEIPALRIFVPNHVGSET